MDLQQIKELALLMQQTGLTSLHLTEGAVNIQMERAGTAAAVCAQPIQTECPQPPQENPKPQQEGHKVLSPMVGVFYSAPSPQSKPFVEVGSRVKKGDVLCIVEAMKLMNEITAELDGEIVEVCAASGDVVEYGQTLFRIQ
jgi:acetyl-CoA carboxylase biotin carboxyl carrier protein